MGARSAAVPRLLSPESRQTVRVPREPQSPPPSSPKLPTPAQCRSENPAPAHSPRLIARHRDFRNSQSRTLRLVRWAESPCAPARSPAHQSYPRGSCAKPFSVHSSSAHLQSKLPPDLPPRRRLPPLRQALQSPGSTPHQILRSPASCRCSPAAPGVPRCFRSVSTLPLTPSPPTRSNVSPESSFTIRLA